MQFGEFAPPAPFEEVSTGQRVAAALIDLVLLACLNLILALTVGEYHFGDGGFSVSLTGVWLLLYFALGLLYYFATEAVSGQTVGKRLLGLRVHRTDGSRPPVGAIAGRTLLRIIDWLPGFYLFGFVVMLVTRPSRQRLGDLVAGTVVRRAPAGQRRGLAVASLVLMLAAAVGLTVYRATASEDIKTYQGAQDTRTYQGAQDTTTYRGHGIQFDYPASWNEVTLTTAGSDGGRQELWAAGVEPPGAGPYDLVAVSAYRVDRAESADWLAASVGELIKIAGDMYGQDGGTLQGDPQRVTIGGMPGVRFVVTLPADGTQVALTEVFLFTGTTKYSLQCVATAAQRAAVDRSCDQLQRTFTQTEGTTAPR